MEIGFPRCVCITVDNYFACTSTLITLDFREEMLDLSSVCKTHLRESCPYSDQPLAL